MPGARHSRSTHGPHALLHAVPVPHAGTALHPTVTHSPPAALPCGGTHTESGEPQWHCRTAAAGVPPAHPRANGSKGQRAAVEEVGGQPALVLVTVAQCRACGMGILSAPWGQQGSLISQHASSAASVTLLLHLAVTPEWCPQPCPSGDMPHPSCVTSITPVPPPQ